MKQRKKNASMFQIWAKLLDLKVCLISSFDLFIVFLDANSLIISKIKFVKYKRIRVFRYNIIEI